MSYCWKKTNSDETMLEELLNGNKLLDNGFLEVEDEHFRISDGLLCKYIQKFR